MAVVLNKRNIRLLSVTVALLLLTVFVVQNARYVSGPVEGQLTQNNAAAAAAAAVQESGNTGAQVGTGSETETQAEAEVAAAAGRNSDTSEEEAAKEKVAAVAAAKEEEEEEEEKKSSKAVSGDEKETKPNSPETNSMFIHELYTSILEKAPIIIFSKTYCSYSKALKDLFAKNFVVKPEIYVVELDEHEYGKELQEFLTEFTGRATVPNIIVNGVARGGFDGMNKLFQEGKLEKQFNSWAGRKFKLTKIEK